MVSDPQTVSRLMPTPDWNVLCGLGIWCDAVYAQHHMCCVLCCDMISLNLSSFFILCFYLLLSTIHLCVSECICVCGFVVGGGCMGGLVGVWWGGGVYQCAAVYLCVFFVTVCTVCVCGVCRLSVCVLCVYCVCVLCVCEIGRA